MNRRGWGGYGYWGDECGYSTYTRAPYYTWCNYY